MSEAIGLKILFLSAEVAPYAKTGGLGDVVGSLPGSAVPIYFIAERNLFDRPNIYGYHDDPHRFAFFSKAALELTQALNWRPDIVHGHDWHAAPAITWLSTAGQADSRYGNIPTLFTIHNLAHQGRARWDIFDYLSLLTHRLDQEKYGEVNFMARGIYHATLVNTVSPTYAREIMTPEGGAGLDGLLRRRRVDLHGILNGLDYDVWNPTTDARLARPFDAYHIDERVHTTRPPSSRRPDRAR